MVLAFIELHLQFDIGPVCSWPSGDRSPCENEIHSHFPLQTFIGGGSGDSPSFSHIFGDSLLRGMVCGKMIDAQ